MKWFGTTVFAHSDQPSVALCRLQAAASQANLALVQILCPLIPTRLPPAVRHGSCCSSRCLCNYQRTQCQQPQWCVVAAVPPVATLVCVGRSGCIEVQNPPMSKGSSRQQRTVAQTMMPMCVIKASNTVKQQRVCPILSCFVGENVNQVCTSSIQNDFVRRVVAVCPIAAR